MFTDEGLQQEIDNTVLGSVDYVLLQMKRQLFFEQVLREVHELWGKASSTVDSNRCGRCGVLFYYQQTTSSNVCPQCGQTVFVLENDLVSFHSRSRYNRNARHVYAKHEHFYQTLVDMTCTGRRKVDMDVVRYCSAVLGRGAHVTFDKVFNVLQIGGFKKSYCNRYEISARLRGRPEIVLTPRETELVRGHYARYDACFHDFQIANGIGNRTQSGRLRLFWPVRFVMAEMFKLIDRPDLVSSVRGIAGKKRFDSYAFYWKKLRTMVDHRRPDAGPGHVIALTRLDRPLKRPRYLRPRQLPPKRPLHQVT
jgi:DNA-directed RNA polymerase subunit RPC12/RpoP